MGPLIIAILILIGNCAVFAQNSDLNVVPLPNAQQVPVEDSGLLVEKPAHDNMESALSDLVEIYLRNDSKLLEDYAQRRKIQIKESSVLSELVFLKGYKAEDINDALLRDFNIEVESRSEHFLICWIPIDKLADFAESLENIAAVHRPKEPVSHIVTEGLELIGADVFHDEGIEGDGVTVGVFDLGFDLAAEARQRGELPNYTARNFTQEDFNDGSVHGTGCSEIVYDLVPEAEFHLIKIWNTADFEQALDYSAEEGIDVVSMSLGWIEPMGDYFRGEDVMSRLVDEYYAGGLFFIQSAGNEGMACYREDFDDEGARDHYHRFDDGVVVNHFGPDEDESYELEEGEYIVVSLVWDDFPRTGEDFDLELVRFVNNSWRVEARSNDRQNGNDNPSEFISFLVEDEGEYGIRILRYDADNGMDFTVRSYNHDLGYNFPAGSIGIPALAENCFAVGAVDYRDWNDRNVRVERFSSQGPTYDGRMKPDIAGPDGVSTYAYGEQDRAFYGTSASCPHAAGAAALALSANRNMDNDDIWSYLAENAVDAGEEGPDNQFGHGKLNLEMQIDVPEGIFINELQADNRETIEDPAGDTDDWIELYNATNDDIDLSGLYLSDNPNDPDMWEIPEGTVIEARRFLLIWADREVNEEGLHANFTLSIMGEEVGVYFEHNGEFTQIDAVDYPRLQADWSYGRVNDGGDRWQEFEEPTPNQSNRDNPNEPGEDWIIYDDGEPAVLYTLENYWSKVIFTPETAFRLENISFMPLNPGPNPDAPCEIKVYSNDRNNNLAELLWETTIDRLDPFNWDEMDNNWYLVEIPEDDWMEFNAGENFTVMYGPAPGGEYDPNNMQEGDGWWNLCDDATEVNRSFTYAGDDPIGNHREWTLIENDLLLRANGSAVEVEPPVIVVEPDEIESNNGGEYVIEIANDGASNLVWRTELEIIDEPERDRGVRSVRSTERETESAGVIQNIVDGGEIDPKDYAVWNSYINRLRESAGVPDRDRRGEPDQSGYFWIDSDEQGGPEYQWVDIANAGREFNAGDDWNSGAIELGFDFEWYGETYDEVYICSNGWVSFTSEDTDYQVPRPPNREEPNALLLVNQFDINPAAGGDILFWSNEEFAVVSWINAPMYGNENIRSTFQVIITIDGVIFYNYAAQAGVNGSAQNVGCENADGSMGASIIYREANRIEEGLSIAILQAQNDWISWDPQQGVVEPDREQEVTVLLNSAGLRAGDYEAELHFLSNDPENEDVAVNIIMHVEEEPAIVIEPEELDFGDVIIDWHEERNIVIINVGNELLEIDNIESDNDAFTVDFDEEIGLEPNNWLPVTVSFTPEEAADYEGTLTIFSNDPDDEEVEVALTGTGVEGIVPGEDWVGYDDGFPARLYTVENYWSKVTFNIQDDFTLHGVRFMPYNIGPNPNAPCEIRVYREGNGHNLGNLVWETEIERLMPWDRQNVEANWHWAPIVEDNRPFFEAGDNFTVMYGPAPGGEYDFNNLEEGDGWWNLTDSSTVVNRSFIFEGDEPEGAHAEWTEIPYDLMLRANGTITRPDPPQLSVDPEPGRIEVELASDDDPEEVVIILGNEANEDASDLEYMIELSDLENRDAFRHRNVRRAGHSNPQFHFKSRMQLGNGDRAQILPADLNRRQRASIGDLISSDNVHPRALAPNRDHFGDVLGRYDIPYALTTDLEWVDGMMWGVCIDADNASHLIALNPRNGNVEEDIELESFGVRMTFDGRYFWISAWGEEEIVQYDLNGRRIRSINAPIPYPGGMASDRDDYVFISDWDRDEENPDEREMVIYVYSIQNRRQVGVIDYLEATDGWYLGGLVWVDETPDAPLWGLGGRGVYQFSIGDNWRLALERFFPIPSAEGYNGIGIGHDGVNTWHGLAETAEWVIVDDGEYFDWLSVDPEVGSIEPGEETEVSLIFDPDGLDDGFEETVEMIIYTNDPENESVAFDLNFSISDEQVPELRHFIDFDRTDINHSLLILSLTHEEEDVPTGWEVGVFTPGGLLAGAGVWIEGERLGFPAWGDEQGGEINGFRPGEALNFRAWDFEADEEYRTAPQWVNGPHNWAANGFTVVNLETMLGRDLTVEFSAGWNMISINVVPGQEFWDEDEDRGPDIILMTEQLRIDEDNHHIALMKNGLGQFYSPAWGFCNIPYWNLADGYLVNMDEDIETVWPGEPIPADEDIPLMNGWNMIAYFPTYELDVSAPDFYGISPIVEHVDLMKDGLGHFLSTAFNFSNMDPLRETQGYQIKVDDDIVLNYPEPQRRVFTAAEKDADRRWASPKITDRNMSVLITQISGADAQQGDEIAVLNGNGVAVGRGVVDGSGRCGLAVWGDDEATPETEGLQENEAFSLTYWNRETGEETPLTVESTLHGEGLVYSDNGFTVVQTGVVDAIPEEYYLGDAFPNPFNAVAKIGFGLPESGFVSIQAYDLSGRLVSTLAGNDYQAGNHAIVWNANGISSGIYLIKMNVNGFSSVKKLTLMR